MKRVALALFLVAAVVLVALRPARPVPVSPRGASAHPDAVVAVSAAAPQGLRGAIRELPDPAAAFDRVPGHVRSAMHAELAALGWTPTNTVGRISRGVRPDVRGPGLRKVQSGSVASGDGEMVVWDWSDGNPDTMEGEVYWYDYASGQEMLLYVQYGTADEYDPAPMAGGAIWVNNSESVGGGSVWVKVPQRAPAPSLQRVAFRSNYCCVSAEQLNGLQRDCMNTNTSQVTKNTWLYAGIGASLGAVIGSLKGAPGGPAVSLAGAFIGAVEGAGSGALGNWIGNFIVANRDGNFSSCTRETSARTWCQMNQPDARMMIWGYPAHSTPGQCWQ